MFILLDNVALSKLKLFTNIIKVVMEKFNMVLLINPMMVKIQEKCPAFLTSLPSIQGAHSLGLPIGVH